MASLRVERVVVEHGPGAEVLGTTRPRLSWRLAPGPRDWLQEAYEVKVERDSAVDSRRVESADSVLVPWPFEPLAPRERARVLVRVHGIDGSVSDWSEPEPVEVGLLSWADWHARFVSPEELGDFRGAHHFSGTFRAAGDVVDARLYVTALGVFEPYVNGTRIGDHVLDPGWTSYGHRVLYSTFDVTDRVHRGENTLGAVVADGWYRGRLGFNGGRFDIYGDRPAVLAQLELTYADGTTEVVCSDETWRVSRGPVVSTSIYDGESVDHRAASSDWSPVRTLDVDARLEPLQAPPARRIESIRPVEISRHRDALRLDFGQNLVGWIAFTATGEPGQTLVVRHAEVLEDGELCLRPLRTAKAEDTYVLSGATRERCEPRFTYHGFRYAEISGGDVDVDSIEAIVMHSDVERTGWFECSDTDVNRLHENVVWSMRGNFVTLPTDCPQRDERLGWTGDVQIFTPTACFLYDVDAFLCSWLADVEAEQTADGRVPNFVPDPQVDGDLPDDLPAAAWGDAAVIVPWTLYDRYGDTGILERQYESMRSWVDHVETRLSSDGVWESDWQYGDWLDPVAPPGEPWAARTETALVATAYAAWSARLFANAARVLGRGDVASAYDAVAARRRAAFVQRFVRPGGRLTSDAQTAYALALVFELVDDGPWCREAAARLVELAAENGFRIGTGFVGTPIICDALSRYGHDHAALRLLLQRDCPSWLYPVTMDATTMWERWDSMLPDGSVNPGQMTSFNHYALGSVADWLHRVVAGLAPGAPGYRRIVVQPRPGPGITSASARLHSPYGLVETSWHLDGEQFDLRVVVPPNAVAEVWLPDAAPVEVGSGSHTFRATVRSRLPDLTP